MDQESRKNLVVRVLHLLGNVAFGCLMVLMLALVFFLVKSNLSGGTPSIAGYQMYVVLSGSMSPAFDAGSIVMVQPVEAREVSVGDVITFRDPTDNKTFVTHRVVAIDTEDGLSFITKGDANSVEDFEPVPDDNVVGMVQMSVPYAGYIVSFARTKKGLLSLVIVPGVLIILFELRNLLAYSAAMEKEKKAKLAAEAESASEVDMRS